MGMPVLPQLSLAPKMLSFLVLTTAPEKTQV
jgi:hypothetical protein